MFEKSISNRKSMAKVIKMRLNATIADVKIPSGKILFLRSLSRCEKYVIPKTKIGIMLIALKTFCDRLKIVGNYVI